MLPFVGLLTCGGAGRSFSRAKEQRRRGRPKRRGREGWLEGQRRSMSMGGDSWGDVGSCHGRAV